jgi:hypothetical protein
MLCSVTRTVDFFLHTAGQQHNEDVENNEKTH